jgi:hypothetical protein
LGIPNTETGHFSSDISLMFRIYLYCGFYLLSGWINEIGKRYSGCPMSTLLLFFLRRQHGALNKL